MRIRTAIKKTLIVFVLLFPLSVYAAELTSPNYKITGVTTNQGGIIQTTDGDYSALLEAGRISNNPRNYSATYKLYTSPEDAFIAAVPTVSCFETTTLGHSDCTTGPSQLSTGGMVAICGPSGCYDRARFEIGNSNNPADTLYGVMISTDNFVSDIKELI